jgi:uncharacterized protein
MTLSTFKPASSSATSVRAPTVAGGSAVEINEKFVSADSHIIEPRNLWLERLDKRFRHRAPRFVRRGDADQFEFEGLKKDVPNPPVYEEGKELMGLELRSGAMVTKRAEGQQIDRSGKHHEDARPGVLDPVARLADQDLDNIRAEVIYPGFADRLFEMPDAELKRACIHAYNNWLAEYCSAVPNRLLGAGLLPIGEAVPIQWAVEEAQYIKKLGLVAGLIPCEPKRCYVESHYRPLWQAMQDMRLPAAVHSASSENPVLRMSRRLWIAYCVDTKIGTVQRTMCELIAAAVPQEFPNLNFIMVEGGIGWVAGALQIMDHRWNDHRGWIEPKLVEPPSFYAKRQFY